MLDLMSLQAQILIRQLLGCYLILSPVSGDLPDSKICARLVHYR